ncbi:hypothetical protein BN175_1640051 [Clostridioides difficile T23]|uniref:Uncharacterized protein n=1 Tax=Clostridioides difficile TaxID=1496 RepID=A0A069A498_CLODI|nr:hypothetical protein BN173_2120039 [Clostridioides difficile T11]CCL30485.1 hypothetical protein BN174_1950050 [Clostridioides difficile E15]CCL34461.1 hypothetical protein BN175_1640051 [Clostridioides difficile T23]CCL38321.1 hypothetical protein BN176_2040025 [Clostridioides difficile E19]CCL82050.1 hypothetical protein BN187_330050 [Clostridioides difficile E12]CCL83914.1 hypothetical protein BN188_1520059 [Clostridioides difficile T19]CCL91759.1 hypothetical protein BN190_2780017 [Clo
MYPKYNSKFFDSGVESKNLLA